MKRIVIGWLLIAGMLIVGCATTNSEKITVSTRDLDGFSRKEIAAYNANPENKNKIICSNEKPVGSNLPKRVCRWESAIRDRESQSQAVMQDVQRNTPPPPSK